MLATEQHIHMRVPIPCRPPGLCCDTAATAFCLRPPPLALSFDPPLLLCTPLPDQLNVSAGVEFIAARKALIELLKQDQQQAAAATAGPGPQQQQQQHTWLQMCVAADRPVAATLMGLWGALGPWQRLELLCGVAWMLLWKVGCCWRGVGCLLASVPPYSQPCP